MIKNFFKKFHFHIWKYDSSINRKCIVCDKQQVNWIQINFNKTGSLEDNWI